MKVFTISVCKGDQIPGSDYEHVVRIVIHEDGKEIGKTHLPGGTFEDAKKMAENFKYLADEGWDLTNLLPDAVKSEKP